MYKISQMVYIFHSVLSPVDKQIPPVCLRLVYLTTHTVHERIHRDPRDPENDVEVLRGNGGVAGDRVVEAVLGDLETRQHDIQVLIPEFIRNLCDEIRVHLVTFFVIPFLLQFYNPFET